MPLYKIPNQPLFTDPNQPTVEYCPGDYCHIVLSDDPIYVQWYQTACGLNETCDDNFTDVSLGADLAATGCADPIIVLSDPSWTCGAAPTDPTFTKTTSAAYETVNFTGLGLTQYSVYKITFTITGRTQGGIKLAIGGTPTASFSSWYTDNGTYTVYLQMQSPVPADDDFWIYGSGSFLDPFVPIEAQDPFLGTVHDISIQEVASNCWDGGSGTWDMDGLGGACKTGTGTGVLTDNIGGNYLLAATYYELTFVISNYAAGTLTPQISNVVVDPISGNGTFKRYGTPSAPGVIAFTPDADFVGCVETVDIRALKNDYLINMFYLDPLISIIHNISSYLTYYNEFVTLCVSPSQVPAIEGCWQLNMYDDCDVQYGDYVQNPTFSGGGSPDFWTPATDWRRSLAGGGVYTGVDAQFDFLNGATPPSVVLLYASAPFQTIDPFIVTTQNINYVAGNYNISVRIRANTDVVNNGIRVSISGGQITPSVVFKTVGVHNYNVVYDPTIDSSSSLRAQLVGSFTVNGSIEVDDINITRLAPYSATYESDCFKVVASAPKTKLFIGTSDKETFGFEFVNSGFKLLQRLECRALNPTWPINRDGYTYSTGSSNLNYAEIEKYFELFIEACPATSHGALALQMNIDFSIGNIETDAVEYYVADGDYTPEWDRTGASDIAPSRISLKIKDSGMLFNRSC